MPLLAPDRASAGPRRRPPWRLLAALAVVALAAVVGVQVVGVARDLMGSAEQRTVDHSPAPLMLALSDLAEYHAATGTFQAVVDLERDTPYLPPLISGERTTLLATGHVNALVDLSELGPDRVVAAPDGNSVTIALPPPRLAPASVDPAASRIVDRDRGLVERLAGVLADDPVDDGELYRLAAQRLDEAAAQSDLLTRAETSTREMLTTLAGSLGYERVTVTFDAPAPD